MTMVTDTSMNDTPTVTPEQIADWLRATARALSLKYGGHAYVDAGFPENPSESYQGWFVHLRENEICENGRTFEEALSAAVAKIQNPVLRAESLRAEAAALLAQAAQLETPTAHE